jgi:DNA processing protein
MSTVAGGGDQAGSVDERRAWIALAAVEGVGEIRFGRLIAAFGGAGAVLETAAQGGLQLARRVMQAEAHVQLDTATVENIRATARDPFGIERRMQRLGVWALTPLDAGFPHRLRELDPVLAVLFGQGDPDAARADGSIAVVGTRRPTLAGRALAARVATRLAQCGATRLAQCGAIVFSGLAIGIDGAAHAATLEAGGRTVAVIGGGHTHPGPRAHRAMVERILATGGAVIGELAPDLAPSRSSFPKRNRLISILTDATLVIEAPLRSGALITARHALEQGRTVLAAPGRPGDPSTAGCLALLRETPARPLVGLDELVVDLELHGQSTRGRTGERPTDLDVATALRLLGPAERAVAERLSRGPASADALIVDTGLTPAVASGAITLLLLRGWAQSFGPAYLAAGPLMRQSRGGGGAA